MIHPNPYIFEHFNVSCFWLGLGEYMYPTQASGLNMVRRIKINHNRK